MVVLVVGLAFVLATRPGIRIAPDSVAYLAAAENLRDGQGLELSASYPNLEPLIRGEHPFPLIHWAPLYPALLAGGARVVGGPIQAARWLMLLTLLANLLLFALILWRLSGRRPAVTLAGTAALAVSPVGFPLHQEALSDPLFLLLALAGLELLAVYLVRGRRRWLLAAGAILALALLIRYAGLPLLGAALIGLAAFSPGDLRRRILRGLSVCALVSLPLLGWLTRNAVLAGSATGRSGLVWHPPVANDIRQAGEAITGWFASTAAPAGGRLLIATAVVGCLAAALWRLRPLPSLWSDGPPDRKVRTVILLSFGLFYLGFLALSKFFFDAANPVDTRGFAPAFAALALCGMAWIGDALVVTKQRRAPLLRAALGGALALIAVGYVHQSVVAGRDLARASDSYLGAQWRDSATLEAVRAVDPAVGVYSNAPEAVYLLLHRHAASVPVRVDPISHRIVRYFRGDLRRMGRRIEQRRAVLAWFDEVDRWYLPTRSAIVAGITAGRIRTADGEVFGDPHFLSRIRQ